MDFTQFKNKMEDITDSLVDDLNDLDEQGIDLTTNDPDDMYNFPNYEKPIKSEEQKMKEEKANQVLTKLNLVDKGSDFFNRAFDAMDSINNSGDDFNVDDTEETPEEPIEEEEEEMTENKPVENEPVEPTEEKFTFTASQLNDLVNMAIKKRIAGKAPKVTSENKLPITVNDFKKLDYKARLDLYKKNPVAYKMLVDKSR